MKKTTSLKMEKKRDVFVCLAFVIFIFVGYSVDAFPTDEKISGTKSSNTDVTPAFIPVNQNVTTKPTTTSPIPTTPSSSKPTSSSTTTPLPTKTPSTTPPPPSTSSITPPTSPTSPTSSSTIIPPSTSTASPPKPDRSFDLPSFVGGIILALGVLAIGFVVYKFYRARTDPNYRTL